MRPSEKAWKRSAAVRLPSVVEASDGMRICAKTERPSETSASLGNRTFADAVPIYAVMYVYFSEKFFIHKIT
ncbi:hypothetical protein BG910_02205 [Neisseria chenwenguii]|uniref:Uncharacterized protein n=1 Tax=Neisseria chenwenguii TaxID=1853278 RepID=A0A220S0H4_9NEIS|nr:hypothetical protein BG910_02205 [Neisseria chenwenguii]ROV56377.1 hypothetical protein EGS38_05010 [Neisseria chenwenguii]